MRYSDGMITYPSSDFSGLGRHWLVRASPDVSEQVSAGWSNAERILARDARRERLAADLGQRSVPSISELFC